MSTPREDANRISTALARLEKLQPDKYIIAFGPSGKQFIGSPNGYSAAFLTEEVVGELANDNIKKVLWASFGDTPDSWFFAFELKNGLVSIRLGDGVPRALHDYVDHLSTSNHILRYLRVQLGHNGSYVLWSKNIWACYNIPEDLRARLCDLSSNSRVTWGVFMGSFRQEGVSNVQWHEDGSFYLRTMASHAWKFGSNILQDAWCTMWSESMGPEDPAELAFVAIDPHALASDTFAFVKRQKPGLEAQFILHFGQELVHARLAAVDHHLQTTIPKPENTYVLWATSKKAGRSHADAWELKLKTGEKVKVLQEMGNNWFVVEGRKGTKGWVHGSWLEFSNDRPQQDAKTAYQQFSNEVQKMLVPGQLRVFPSLAGYVDSCTSADCRPVKDDGSLTGFCVHDLETLLRGSECYAQAWLKEQRNVWHPDRFARFCEPAHAGQLKIKAEQLFVLYGVLMQQESAQ